MPAIRRHPMADPMADPHRPMADPGTGDGRSGDIRWPIQRPAGRPGAIRCRPGAIRCPPRRDPLPAQARSDGRDPPPAIRDPPVRVPYGN
jgi:hypothetical protein